MDWIPIKNESDLYEIQEISDNERVLIMKCSPGCMIGFAIRLLLNREWNGALMNMKTYQLDILKHNDLSEQIASEFKIEHHSPQVLIIKNGVCIHTTSDGNILFSDLKQFANK